jgi:hypothetical protein
MRQTSARGQFVVVRLKVWFDEHTISPNRGDGPRTPNPRRFVLGDANVLVIGHENSLLHRKTYLGLDSAPPITREISPLTPGL